MCFMNIENRRDIPKVSYATALDYFVGGCFAFVLATIIQFAGVHFFTKHGSGEVIHLTDSEDDSDTEQKVSYVRETDGRTDGRLDRQKNRRTDGQIERKIDGRKEA